MSQKFSSSELVIEGEVISQSVHLDSRYGVVTKNGILVKSIVYSNFENTFIESDVTDTITVYTFGGENLDKGLLYVHDLHLTLGDFGMFFLDAEHEVEQEDAYESYIVFSGQQGFYKYGPSKDQTLISPFWTDGAQEDLFNEIRENTDGGIDKESFLAAEGHWVVIPEIASVGLEFSEIDLFLEDRYADLISIKSMSLGFTFADSDMGSNVVSSGKLQAKTNFGLLADGYDGGFSQVSSTYVTIDLEADLDDVIKIPGGGLVARIQVDNDLLGLFNDGELEISTTLSSGQTVVDDETVKDVDNVEVIKVKTDSNFNCEVGEVSVEPFRNGAGVRSSLAQRCSNRENGGIVTIIGCNFGDIDPSEFCDLLPGGSDGYRVEFDKFGTGTGKVTPLCTDYIKWSDEEIQVHVPSVCFGVTYFIGIPSVTSTPEATNFAVSGVVNVVTPGTNPGVVGEIEVVFTALNGVASNMAIRHQLHDATTLSPPVMPVEGYKLYFTPSYRNALPIAPFNSALANWRIGSYANFEMVPYSDRALYARACEIDYGPITVGNVGDAILGYTPPDLNPCSTQSNPTLKENFVNSFKIIFSNDVNWDNVHDLESVALHELGHAHQLGHVEDTESIMYPSTSSSTLARVLDQGTIDGGIHVVFASFRDEICGPSHTPLSHSCSTSSVSDQAEVKPVVFVSPNPSPNRVMITSDDLRIGDEVLVYNLFGKLVLQRKVYTSNTVELETSNLRSGPFYLTILRGGNVVFSGAKIVVQR